MDTTKLTDEEVCRLLLKVRQEVTERGGEDMIRRVYVKDQRIINNNYFMCVAVLHSYKAMGLKAAKMWIDSVWLGKKRLSDSSEKPV